MANTCIVPRRDDGVANVAANREELQLPEEGKAVTEHAGANSAIKGLRSVAATLKRLGDENLALEEKLNQRDERMESLEADLAEARIAEAQVREWRGLLDDFRLSLVDREELLKRTVGER